MTSEHKVIAPVGVLTVSGSSPTEFRGVSYLNLYYVFLVV